VAVHDAGDAPPRVADLHAGTAPELLRRLTAQVQRLIQERGGALPPLAVQEVIENLAHAQCRGITIDLREGGNALVVADHGPGIADRERALRPGYSSADEAMRRRLRGVGAGLPLLKRLVEAGGGQVTIDDNLGAGTVVTLTMRGALASSGARPGPRTPLTDRHKRILLLLAELGEAGPSVVAKEISISLSSAHRELTALQELGMVEARRGKRSLTAEGVAHLDVVFK
jgi:anti-sigma regulatory factor (Ser/Thr protein kinase)